MVGPRRLVCMQLVIYQVDRCVSCADLRLEKCGNRCFLLSADAVLRQEIGGGKRGTCVTETGVISSCPSNQFIQRLYVLNCAIVFDARAPIESFSFTFCFVVFFFFFFPFMLTDG